jgi:hypothetical protein
MENRSKEVVNAVFKIVDAGVPGNLASDPSWVLPRVGDELPAT